MRSICPQDIGLAHKAAAVLPNLALNNVAIKHAEILAGDVAAAPFDKIIINIALAPKLLHTLLAQLTEGGRLFVTEDVGIKQLVEYVNNSGNYSRLELFEVP